MVKTSRRDQVFSTGPRFSRRDPGFPDRAQVFPTGPRFPRRDPGFPDGTRVFPMGPGFPDGARFSRQDPGFPDGTQVFPMDLRFSRRGQVFPTRPRLNLGPVGKIWSRREFLTTREFLSYVGLLGPLRKSSARAGQPHFFAFVKYGLRYGNTGPGCYQVAASSDRPSELDGCSHDVESRKCYEK